MAVLSLLEQLADRMSHVFLTVLNLSAAACYAIVSVLLLRLAFGRLPRKYTFFAWMAVGFRLLCPVSIKSVFSLFNLGFFDMTPIARGNAMAFIPYDVAMMREPKVYTGIAAVNDVLSGSLPVPDPSASVNPLQVWELLLTLLWLFGLLAFCGYAVISFVKIRKRIACAVPVAGEPDVFECDGIPSPFAWGILRHRIFIPFRMGEKERRHVLAHERAHIRGGDTAIKPFAFLLLAVHWFNPLVWAAYFCLCRDMELRADERVLADMSEHERAEYGMTLLSLAAPRRAALSTLGFGESSIARRIKNALSFKKPAKWLSELAVILAAVLLIALSTNAAGKTPGSGVEQQPLAVPGGRTAYAFKECLYMTPLSSYLVPEEGTGELYIRAGDAFLIADAATMETKAEFEDISWEFIRFDEEWYRSTFFAEYGESGGSMFAGPDISRYENRSYTVLDDSHLLLRMDEETWFVKLGRHGGTHAGEPYCWSIYRLERAE
ncbi:MAG: M56 family metallopeptidase [Clostridiales bacterium]|nr:M56 family metallopeptidase [Clostridiales bacterium]